MSYPTIKERAFPRVPTAQADGQPGMALRDYFAAKALGSFLCRSSYDDETFTQSATDAYRYADAMMEARNK